MPRCGGTVAVRAAVVALLFPVLATASPPPSLVLHLDRFNGSYENLEAFVSPVRAGGLTIRLTSPQHRLEVKSNRLSLSRLANGMHRMEGVVRFSGQGLIHADVELGGMPASFLDRVEFPDQERVIEAEIEIDEVENGYRLTAVSLPPYVEIEMRSHLGSEIVSLCQRLALLIAGDAGCSDLESKLQRPRLPLPEPGTTRFIGFVHLTPDERSLIDEYLSGP